MNGTIPVLYYPIDHYDNVMSIIRNEEPLVLILNDLGGGSVATNEKEPVGSLAHWKISP